MTAERYYGFSALLSGLGRMWRAAVPALVVLVVNAVVQVVLLLPDPQVSWTLPFLVLLVLSAAMFLVTAGVLAAGAYEAAAGPAPFGAVLGRFRRHAGRFVVWVVVQAVAITLGWLVSPLLGTLVAWVTVYVPVAAVSDDSDTPFVANFRAIGRHPVRWVVTGVIVGILLTLGFLLSALNTFFISGWMAGALAMLVGGLFSWWYLTAWACLYRSRQ